MLLRPKTSFFVSALIGMTCAIIICFHAVIPFCCRACWFFLRSSKQSGRHTRIYRTIINHARCLSTNVDHLLRMGNLWLHPPLTAVVDVKMQPKHSATSPPRRVSSYKGCGRPKQLGTARTMGRSAVSVGISPSNVLQNWFQTMFISGKHGHTFWAAKYR